MPPQADVQAVAAVQGLKAGINTLPPALYIINAGGTVVFKHIMAHVSRILPHIL